MRKKFDEIKDGEKFIFAGVRYVKVMEESFYYNAVEERHSGRASAFAGGEICIVYS